MEKIIECVPNFSEGRNKETIKAITDAIESVKGIRLLDVDPGEVAPTGPAPPAGGRFRRRR